MRDDFTDLFGTFGASATAPVEEAIEPGRDDFVDAFGQFGGGENLLTPDFDPQGTGYDYETLNVEGLGPDESGHFPSFSKSGQLLKGQKHPTIQKTLDAEEARGYDVFEGKGGRFFHHERPPKLTSTKLGKTPQGRDIYLNERGRDAQFSFSSERSMTFEADEKFYNYPRIHNGEYLTGKAAFDIFKKNKGIDPETGEQAIAYNTEKEAIAAADARSGTLGSKLDPEVLKKHMDADEIKEFFGDPDDGPAADTIFTIPRKMLSRWVDSLPDVFKPQKIAFGTIETLGEFMTGFAASVPAGLAGLYELAITNGDYEKAEALVAQVHDAFTAEVQSKYGHAIKEVADVPFEAYTGLTEDIVESGDIQGGTPEEHPFSSALLKAVFDGPLMLVALHGINIGVGKGARAGKKFVSEAKRPVTDFQLREFGYPVESALPGKKKGLGAAPTVKGEADANLVLTKSPPPIFRTPDVIPAKEPFPREGRPEVVFEPRDKAPEEPFPSEPPQGLHGTVELAPPFRKGEPMVGVTIHEGKEGWEGRIEGKRVTDIYETPDQLLEDIKTGQIDYSSFKPTEKPPEKPPEVPPEEPPPTIVLKDPIREISNRLDRDVDGTTEVFRGHGREALDDPVAGAAGPVFGREGKYYSFEKKDAKEFGPEVETVNLAEQIKSPYIITSDLDFRIAAGKAGVTTDISVFKGKPEDFKNYFVDPILNMIKKIENKDGTQHHDSIIIDFDPLRDVNKKDEITKGLRRTFGTPQVFIFGQRWVRAGKPPKEPDLPPPPPVKLPPERLEGLTPSETTRDIGEQLSELRADADLNAEKTAAAFKELLEDEVRFLDKKIGRSKAENYLLNRIRRYLKNDKTTQIQNRSTKQTKWLAKLKKDLEAIEAEGKPTKPPEVKPKEPEVPEVAPEEAVEFKKVAEPDKIHEEFGDTTIVRIEGEYKREGETHKQLEGEYSLVEADDIIPANLVDFTPNPKFPSGVHDRALRAFDKKQQDALREAARKPEMDRITSDDPTPSNGPGTFIEGGIITSGHGREQIQRLMEQTPEGAAIVKDAWIKAAKKFGIDPELVKTYNKPRIYRHLDVQPRNMQELSDLISTLNRTPTRELSAAEGAVGRGKAIKSDTLQMIGGAVARGKKVLTKDKKGQKQVDKTIVEAIDELGMPLLQKLIEDGVYTRDQIGVLFDEATGRFTKRAKDEIVDALVGRIINDAKLLEDTPASVRQKLAQVAPSLIKLQTKDARAEGFDINPDLRLALRNAIKAWRAGHETSKQAFEQTTMFGGKGTELSRMGPRALSLFKTLMDEKPARFGQRIRHFSEDAPRDGQAGMFSKSDATESFKTNFGDLLTKQEAKDALEAMEKGDIIDPKDSAEHAADDIVYSAKVKSGEIFGTKDKIDGERVFPEQPMGMEEFLKQDFQSDRLVYVGPPVKMPKKETGMIIRRIFEGVRDKIKRGSARPDSITEYLRNRFKVSIEEGGVTGGKGVSGQYRSWIRSIRLRRRGHIDTLMHEIGHHFSEMNQGVRDIYKDKALEAEIEGLIPPAYDNLPKNARKEEGFAEYIRLYTTMRPLAREAAPGFTLRFEEFLDKTPVHRAVLDEVTVAIHDWMGLDGRQRVRAKMGGIPFTELVKRFDFNKWWSAQMSSVLTRIGEITRLEELHKQGGFKLEAKDSPRNIAQINFGTSDVYKSFVMDGPMPFDIGKRGEPANIGKSLEAIFKPIKEAGDIAFFEEFLTIAQATVNAKRNLEFLYTDAEIKVFLDLFGRQPKEKQAMFAKAAQEIDVFNKAVLKYAEDGGAIKAEAAEAMRSHMYFVPFWRVSDSFLPKFLKGVKGPGGKAFIKRKGGTGNIESPIMNLFQNTANIIKYTNRNALERRVFEIIRGSQLKKTPNVSTAQLAEVVPTPKELVKVRTEEVIERYRKQGIELTRTDAEGKVEYLVPIEVIREMGIMMQFFRPKLEGLKPNMRIMKDKYAEPFVVKFTKEGEGLLNDLVNQEVRRMPFIDSWVAPVARIKRATVVLDLAFMARNFSRDMVASWVQSKTKLKPGVASVKGSLQIAKDTEMARLMRRMGVGIGSFSHVGGQTRLEFTRERIASITGWSKGTIILKPLELGSRGVRVLEKFGNVTELGSRISEFENTIFEAAKRGGATDAQIHASRQTGKFKDLFKDEDSFANAITQATVNAREVAVEFHDIGTGYLMQALARTVPFFGPRVQGLRKGTRTLFGKGEGNKRVAWAKGFAGITVPFILTSVWNELWGGKDGAPAGRDREDWDKNNWLTAYNDGKPVFRLPIPWEIGTIFGVAPARLFDTIVQRMDGDPNRQDFLIGLNSALWNVIGGAPWPTAALVPYELADNYNRFLERPIESSKQEGKIPGERTNLYTPEILKEIGSNYDISPLKMDHAVRGLFSAFGVLALAGVDLVNGLGDKNNIVDPSSFAGNNSVNRVFFPDANRESSRAVAEFYKNYGRVLQLENTAKGFVKSSDTPTEAEKRFLRNNPDAEITAAGVGGKAKVRAEQAADWLREVRVEMEEIRFLPSDDPVFEGMNKGEIIKWKNTELLKLKREKVKIAQEANIDIKEINEIMRDINKKARLDEKKKTVEQKFAENVENTRTQE